MVATHLVKLACELPDLAGRSLSLWTCAELARTAAEKGLVESISPQSVQRILEGRRLKPWRVHFWLSQKAPLDETFRSTVLEILDLYTRSLDPHERVLSLDEKTSLQPRTRTVPTRPAQPDGVPVHLEHEYQRKGALQLFAAFDTRSGEVIGILRRRKRQVEFIELLERIDRDTPEAITLIHLLCDNLSVETSQKVPVIPDRGPYRRKHSFLTSTSSRSNRRPCVARSAMNAAGLMWSLRSVPTTDCIVSHARKPLAERGPKLMSRLRTRAFAARSWPLFSAGV